MKIQMTDTHGAPLGDEIHHEPNPGSVVLSNGEFGTAWQRHFDDLLWHRSGGGRPITWMELMTKRNIVLVYDASLRVERNPEARKAGV